MPAEIGQLSKLQILWLHDNQLSSLPAEIGQLSKLQHLSLDDNQLSSLPAEIGQLSKLECLYLHGNQLGSLPASMTHLSDLRTLFLHGNPKLKLPETILGPPLAGWDGDDSSAPAAQPILDYYFKTRKGSEAQPLLEGKLILVGRGDVGKTSLVKRLVDNKFSRGEDRTPGIRIRQWPIDVKKNETVKLHVWDFGGQEIMHATHQFFLTDRSLYLLVLDGRGGHQESEADYWLRMISSFAPESPVLVVLNKIRKDPFDLNRGALRDKFPQICGFVETDCDNSGADNKPGKIGHGIDELRTAIAREVNKLPDIRKPFPDAWAAVKNDLSNPRRRKKFLSVDEYSKLCKKHGVTEKQSQKNLSVILHQLGVALNYSDDRRLDDKHVLNPHWLTEGIYTLLNSPTIAKRDGELSLGDLKNELDAKKFPVEIHSFLMDLMRKFELCFVFPNQKKYLIPELLDEQQPKAADTFDPATCLNFLYEYPVVPPGLLPRFVVRTEVLQGKDKKHRWRSGVILDFEGNRALVKADIQDKTVRVLIDGPVEGRRRMLAVIREDFDVIHRDIKHLHPSELVSFPDHPQVTVPYKRLEILFEEDPDYQIKEVANDRMIERSVRELLEGVEFGPINESSRTARLVKAGRLGIPTHDSDFVRVFYSYAHANARDRTKLAKHLSPLERMGLIVTWCDHEILAGAEWEKSIADQLDQSQIILLLISSDFVASQYCYKVELERAMQRQDDSDACVIPIVIRKTNAWEKVPAGDRTLGDLNGLPQFGKPITSFNPRDDGWAQVAAGIQAAAEEIRSK